MGFPRCYPSPTTTCAKWREPEARVYACPRGVRRLIGCAVVAVVAAACGDAVATTPPGTASSGVVITASPSPFQHVSAGPVSAMIPDEWQPRLAGATGDPRQGIVAAPKPGTWGGDRPPVEGMAAMWVDGTEVGVPSDYYYLAATGPALDALTGSERCRATRKYVVADHVPAYAHGAPDSPGDYIAHGQGTCTVGHKPTRWAYFVAAPGYGPVHEVGIPGSGLYVVVAVMPESRRARFLLNRLLERTEFNGSSVAEMLETAASAPPADAA